MGGLRIQIFKAASALLLLFFVTLQVSTPRPRGACACTGLHGCTAAPPRPSIPSVPRPSVVDFQCGTQTICIIINLRKLDKIKEESVTVYLF